MVLEYWRWTGRDVAGEQYVAEGGFARGGTGRHNCVADGVVFRPGTGRARETPHTKQASSMRSRLRLGPQR